jgi:hypothetical protein
MMYYSSSKENSGSVIIRAAHALDGADLRRVAQRDSRAVPEGQLLVAEVDGELRAAIALATGEVIADPFRRTADLVRMLGLRRSQLRGEVRRPSRPAAVPAVAGRLG